MGGDKARLRLGRRTLLGHVKTAASLSRWPVRVVRRDVVPRCGPLGGIYTGLISGGDRWVVFLSCDQPFVAPATLRELARAVRLNARPVFFADDDGVVGFPFALPAKAAAVVTEQIEQGELSLQKLARRLRSVICPIPPAQAWRWFNVNTPAEFERARALWRERGGEVKRVAR